LGYWCFRTEKFTPAHENIRAYIGYNPRLACLRDADPGHWIKYISRNDWQIVESQIAGIPYRAIAYEKKWIRSRWNMGATWGNIGTVLALHFILVMQHKNRPYVAS